MDYSINTKRCLILQIAAILAVIVGLVMATVGIFLFYTVSDYDISGFTGQQIKIIKILDIACILIIGEGFYYIVGGFVAIINNGSCDHYKLIKKYGYIMTALGLLDLIVLLVISRFGMELYFALIVALPLIFGAFYLMGAFLNEKAFIEKEV